MEIWPRANEILYIFLGPCQPCFPFHSQSVKLLSCAWNSRKASQSLFFFFFVSGSFLLPTICRPTQGHLSKLQCSALKLHLLQIWILRERTCVEQRQKESPLPEKHLGENFDPPFLTATRLSFFSLQIQSTLLEKSETEIKHGILAPTCSIYLSQFEKVFRYLNRIYKGQHWQ